ncbi:MAG: amidase family protein [Candidatus Acidiferrales bacterium]
MTGSLAGVPGISVPCGKSKAGLPIGLQLFAKHFDEARLLRLAHAFEQSSGFDL